MDCSFLDDLDLDRKFLNFSANLTNVFSWTYGMLGGRLIAPIDPNKFDNASSKIAELGVRILIVLGTIAAIGLAGTYVLAGAAILGLGGKFCKGLGSYFQKDRVTHIRGKALEKELKDSRAKVLEWNIRGHGGGLHYAEGGVIHWRDRVDRIAQEILREDPDVAILQEVFDTSLIEAIIDRLGPHYAHFYTHLGTSVLKNESGMLVITKCAVHRFSHTNFTSTDKDAQRGFGMLEIQLAPKDTLPCARIIYTQLSKGKQLAEMRKNQVTQIIDALAKEKIAAPTLFVGSLNIDRDSKEEGAYLSNYLFHSYLDTEPTYSHELVSQWAPVFEGQEESCDFISFFKRSPLGDERTFPVIERGIKLVDSHLVKGFDEFYNTKTALSDHHAVVTEVSGIGAN